MVINLQSAWRRTGFAAAVALIAGVLVFFSGKFLFAVQCTASSKPALWQLAAKLEPGNAEYWRHLGLAQQWDAGGDVQDAIRYLQLAARANPRSADAWTELADAYQASGDSTRAQAAYEKARANYPISPEVAWRYGNFLLLNGKQLEGYAEIRRALLVDPSMTMSAIDQCWRSDPHVGPILERVLPDEAEYFRAAMSYFLAQKQVEAAVAVWKKERAIGLPAEISDGIPLVDELVAEDRITEARQVWQENLDAAKWLHGTATEGSLLSNGGFEQEIANGGFDWREVAVDGASFDFDSVAPHAGSRSLRAAFDGTGNVDFHHLIQDVPVEPGTHYHFSAFLRTEAITTDRGLGFEIYDPRHPSEVQAVTPEMVGTNPWTLVHADIATGSETRLLRIVLRRVPSWKFDNKLCGTVWIDDVALAPARAASRDGSG
jgi:Tetratricopeptide repeat